MRTGPRLEVTAAAYPVAAALRQVRRVLAIEPAGDYDLRVRLQGGALVDLVDGVPEISCTVTLEPGADPELLVGLHRELAAVVPWSITRYDGAGRLVEHQRGRLMTPLEDCTGFVRVESGDSLP